LTLYLKIPLLDDQGNIIEWLEVSPDYVTGYSIANIESLYLTVVPKYLENDIFGEYILSCNTKKYLQYLWLNSIDDSWRREK